jgi:hypothetical protein
MGEYLQAKHSETCAMTDNFLQNAVPLAIALSRQPGSTQYTVDEIANDACLLTSAASKYRAAVESRKRHSVHLQHLQSLAARYGARVEERRDPNGMFVGLRLARTLNAGTFRNVFCID